MTGEPIIEAVSLTKRYGGQSVVNGIDFSVIPGECFGLLGPNGAGKSTTLRMLTGLTPIDSGKLLLFGASMHPERRDARARMGVVPQEDNLDLDLSVWENLLVYGRYFGLSRHAIHGRCEELLAFAQLSDRAQAPVRNLSGGMKRRLVIARALIASPQLVILDEPTTGLDPQARHLIWGRLRSLREAGVTLLLTTHYMEEAARLCDRIVILDQGNILDMDSPTRLIARHVLPEVVEIRPNGHDLPDPATLRTLGVHPEQVGDALHCYCQGPGPLLRFLEGMPEITFLHRPANLEDVFLKLTGRDLRE